jgi:hypothetical protein
MAIVQISRITHRKGLQENLPQLAGAELGWSIDERRLFIGNGTLQEGAPVIGNTEILTEFSDILEFQTTYTYQGAAAGYVVQTGASAGTPVSQSLQSWLDQWASVKDFGATGDGVTDDTAAINRALYQIFCREVNPQIRRALFFPAGVYKITESIIIPPYATLYGEGADGSVIEMGTTEDSALTAYVARTGDSLQQTGVNIGANSAITPQYVTISNMGFRTVDPDVDTFLVEDASNCSFNNVLFAGPLVQADLDTDSNEIAGVRFASTTTLVCNTITFDRCVFTGLTYGIATEQQTKGITVSNSKFDTLFKGIALGTTTPVNGGPTGFRIVHNLFDNIYAQGIEMGNIQLNGTGHNIFYDVGNHFNGVLQPATTIIDITGSNNVCFADMFERADSYSGTYARVNLNTSRSITTINGKEMQLGTFIRQSGLSGTLVAASSGVLLSSGLPLININYTIVRSTSKRIGTIVAANDQAGSVSWTDDYNQTGDTGIFLAVSDNSGITQLNYTADAGVDGIIYFSVNTTADVG